MEISNFSKNKHLLSRAGFGINLSQIDSLSQTNPSKIWKQLSKENRLKSLSVGSKDAQQDYTVIAKLSPEEKKEQTKKNRQENISLNLKFFNEMVNSEDQLREKMAFFWNGHFATRVINSRYNEQLLQIVRENALGNFGDLLKAVSKSPSMLQFLNNQQNKKDHPNENFAREVMELFTLGRGNYTEKDVKEAARAFTGWSFSKEGDFTERARIHDFGDKTFLGKTGNFSGDDILDIILAQKSTAIFITIKIYKFFVNDTLDHKIVAKLANNFYNSKYDIKKLMTEIFTSDWFFDEKNIGAKIKSPIELMAGIFRILPVDNIIQKRQLIIYQKLLGQMIFYPPNVAGWPMGKSWIDSSTLLLRMQMPQIFSGLRPLALQPKADDDIQMGMGTENNGNRKFRKNNFIIDWPQIESVFKDKNIAEILLQKQLSGDGKYVKQFSDGSVKMDIIDIMSVPEYQLC